MTSTTAVLGAGALGLTVALRLAQPGERVTVLEREPLPGGLAAGFELEPGMWLEKFYHHLFRSDRRAIAMIDELGLTDRLEWSQPVTATLRERRDAPARLADSASSASRRCRARPRPPRRRPRDPQGDAEPAPPRGPDRHGLDAPMDGRPRLRPRSGSRSCAESSATPRRRSRCPGSGRASTTAPRRSATSRGGFQQLYERLADARPRGRRRDAVRRIGRIGQDGRRRPRRRDRPGRRAIRPGREHVRRPPHGAPRAGAARRRGARQHEWGRAYGAHCVVLALDRPLTSAYWLNVNDPGFPFMALVEHTNYLPAPSTAAATSSTSATTGRWTTRS